MARVDAPVPPGPQTVNSWPSHSGGSRVVEHRRQLVAAADHLAVGRQDVEQFVLAEVAGQLGRHAQVGGGKRRPRATRTTMTGVKRLERASTRSRSKDGTLASTSRAECRRPDANRARTSSADTHLTNSAAMVADVVHWATASNHGARAGASPSRT